MLMNKAFFILMGCLLTVQLSAMDSQKIVKPAVKEAPKSKPFTILKISNYDWSESVEVVKIDEAVWRVQQLNAEYRVLVEADRLARAQWKKWFGSTAQEASVRQWVLPALRPPQIQSYGRFEDEFDTEDKVRELKAEYQKRIDTKLSVTTDYRTKALLDNVLENRKLLKSMLPKAHEALTKIAEKALSLWPEAKKREIWDLVNKTELQAHQSIMETTDDDDVDFLDVYNKQQELLKPIYAQFNMTEDQWYLIWAEGDKKKWPVPAKPETRSAKMNAVLKLLREVKEKPDSAEGQLAQKSLKDLGKSVLPRLIRIAENAQFGLKEPAINALAIASGRSLGSDLTQWKEYVQALESAARPKPIINANKEVVEIKADKNDSRERAARQTGLANQSEE